MSNLLNHKNQFIASGAIKTISPIVSRLYKTSNGEDAEWTTRDFVIRNKFSKHNHWRIVDLPFEAFGDAVDALNLLAPGEEVIVSFLITSSPFEDKRTHKERHWVTFKAWDIIRIKDKPVSDEWWQDKNKDIVRKGTKYKPSARLSEENKKERRPADKAYSQSTFSVREDYSDKPPEEDVPF